VLTAAGAKVYMAEREDGGDVVTTLTKKLGDNALLLSVDRDMFRYDSIDPKQVKANFIFFFPSGEGILPI
jgi:hypothetical protein